MDAKKRRDQIQTILKDASCPLSATALAKRFNVSRQIIVGDVALLRASGVEISSTARGYVYHDGTEEHNEFDYIGIIACKHGKDMLLTELCCVVDYGGCLIDVMIEHPLYGQLSGNLDIRSRYDAEQFAERVNSGKGSPLSALTDGIHLHRIGCKDETVFRRIETALLEKEILLR